MGYYTRYELKWSGAESATEPCPHCNGTGKLVIGDAVKQAVENMKVCAGGTETIRSLTQEQTKWYDHEGDMKEFSKRFPKVLFTLHGEGEESTDVWVKYFKNGKMQIERAKIELADFDPNKLS